MEPTGPQNVVVGDEIALPPTEIPQEQLNEEKLLAKFSKSKEFQRIKDYIEARITFFQQNFPDGTPIAKNSNPEELIAYWRAANIVIAEFKYILQVYENANAVVADAAKKENDAGRVTEL